MQKYISPDQLPQAYGGTRCEPDAWCTNYVSMVLLHPPHFQVNYCDKINPGYDVPVEFYFTNQTNISRDEMERVVIGRGSSHKVVCEITEAESILAWEFVSSDYDVGFGVTLLTEDGKRLEVVCLHIFFPFDLLLVL